MKLYIDTSDREKIIVGVDGEMFTDKSTERASQRLLVFIDEVLEKKKKKLNNITEIEVNTGPGSFTGLRVGVSVANALGWALKVPVNGKRVDRGESVDIIYAND
ncbi:MAG: tRNA (adenosine(37)-N6)-threonylcarbamoyltransferase complex dimerization subunit type 1 TsaB [Patescibacteria group bacterium]